MNWVCIGVSFSVVVAILNAFIFIILKFNDLRHLEKNMEKVLNTLDGLVQRVSKFEGICSVCLKTKNRKR